MRLGKQIKLHIKCGLHSGFPICCVLWFVFVIIPIFGWMKSDNIFLQIRNKFIFWVEQKRKVGLLINLSYQDHITKEIYKKQIYSFGRIPCPICLFFAKDIKEAIDCACRGS